jgi:hypothetical protein
MPRPHLQNLNIFECDRIHIEISVLEKSMCLTMTIGNGADHINFWHSDHTKLPELVIDRQIAFRTPGDDVVKAAWDRIQELAADRGYDRGYDDGKIDAKLQQAGLADPQLDSPLVKAAMAAIDKTVETMSKPAREIIETIAPAKIEIDEDGRLSAIEYEHGGIRRVDADNPTKD